MRHRKDDYSKGQLLSGQPGSRPRMSSHHLAAKPPNPRFLGKPYVRHRGPAPSQSCCPNRSISHSVGIVRQDGTAGWCSSVDRPYSVNSTRSQNAGGCNLSEYSQRRDGELPPTYNVEFDTRSNQFQYMNQNDIPQHHNGRSSFVSPQSLMGRNTSCIQTFPFIQKPSNVSAIYAPNDRVDGHGGWQEFPSRHCLETRYFVHSDQNNNMPFPTESCGVTIPQFSCNRSNANMEARLNANMEAMPDRSIEHQCTGSVGCSANRSVRSDIGGLCGANINMTAEPVQERETTHVRRPGNADLYHAQKSDTLPRFSTIMQGHNYTNEQNNNYISDRRNYLNAGHSYLDDVVVQDISVHDNVYRPWLHDDDRYIQSSVPSASLQYEGMVCTNNRFPRSVNHSLHTVDPKNLSSCCFSGCRNMAGRETCRHSNDGSRYENLDVQFDNYQGRGMNTSVSDVSNGNSRRASTHRRECTETVNIEEAVFPDSTSDTQNVHNDSGTSTGADNPEHLQRRLVRDGQSQIMAESELADGRCRRNIVQPQVPVSEVTYSNTGERFVEKVNSVLITPHVHNNQDKISTLKSRINELSSQLLGNKKEEPNRKADKTCHSTQNDVVMSAIRSSLANLDSRKVTKKSKTLPRFRRSMKSVRFPKLTVLLRKCDSEKLRKMGYVNVNKQSNVDSVNKQVDKMKIVTVAVDSGERRNQSRKNCVHRLPLPKMRRNSSNKFVNVPIKRSIMQNIAKHSVEKACRFKRFYTISKNILTSKSLSESQNVAENIDNNKEGTLDCQTDAEIKALKTDAKETRALTCNSVVEKLETRPPVTVYAEESLDGGTFLVSSEYTKKSSLRTRVIRNAKETIVSYTAESAKGHCVSQRETPSSRCRQVKGNSFDGSMGKYSATETATESSLSYSMGFHKSCAEQSPIIDVGSINQSRSQKPYTETELTVSEDVLSAQFPFMDFKQSNTVEKALEEHTKYWKAKQGLKQGKTTERNINLNKFLPFYPSLVPLYTETTSQLLQEACHTSDLCKENENLSLMPRIYDLKSSQNSISQPCQTEKEEEYFKNSTKENDNDEKIALVRAFSQKVERKILNSMFKDRDCANTASVTWSGDDGNRESMASDHTNKLAFEGDILGGTVVDIVKEAFDVSDSELPVTLDDVLIPLLEEANEGEAEVWMKSDENNNSDESKNLGEREVNIKESAGLTAARNLFNDVLEHEVMNNNAHLQSTSSSLTSAGTTIYNIFSVLSAGSSYSHTLGPSFVQAPLEASGSQLFRSERTPVNIHKGRRRYEKRFPKTMPRAKSKTAHPEHELYETAKKFIGDLDLNNKRSCREKVQVNTVTGAEEEIPNPLETLCSDLKTDLPACDVVSDVNTEVTVVGKAVEEEPVDKVDAVVAHEQKELEAKKLETEDTSEHQRKEENVVVKEEAEASAVFKERKKKKYTKRSSCKKLAPHDKESCKRCLKKGEIVHLKRIGRKKKYIKKEKKSDNEAKSKYSGKVTKPKVKEQTRYKSNQKMCSKKKVQIQKKCEKLKALKIGKAGIKMKMKKVECPKVKKTTPQVSQQNKNERKRESTEVTEVCVLEKPEDSSDQFTVDKLKLFLCHICKEGFDKKGKLSKHCCSEHNWCSKCNKYFSSKEQKRLHLNRNHDVALFCGVCNRTYSLTKSYTCHLKSHTHLQMVKNQSGNNSTHAEEEGNNIETISIHSQSDVTDLGSPQFDSDCEILAAHGLVTSSQQSHRPIDDFRAPDCNSLDPSHSCLESCLLEPAPKVKAKYVKLSKDDCRTKGNKILDNAKGSKSHSIVAKSAQSFENRYEAKIVEGQTISTNEKSPCESIEAPGYLCEVKKHCESCNVSVKKMYAHVRTFKHKRNVEKLKGGTETVVEGKVRPGNVEVLEEGEDTVMEQGVRPGNVEMLEEGEDTVMEQGVQPGNVEMLEEGEDTVMEQVRQECSPVMLVKNLVSGSGPSDGQATGISEQPCSLSNGRRQEEELWSIGQSLQSGDQANDKSDISTGNTVEVSGDNILVAVNPGNMTNDDNQEVLDNLLVIQEEDSSCEDVDSETGSIDADEDVLMIDDIYVDTDTLGILGEEEGACSPGVEEAVDNDVAGIVIKDVRSLTHEPEEMDKI